MHSKTFLEMWTLILPLSIIILLKRWEYMLVQLSLFQDTTLIVSYFYNEVKKRCDVIYWWPILCDNSEMNMVFFVLDMALCCNLLFENGKNVNIFTRNNTDRLLAPRCGLGAWLSGMLLCVKNCGLHSQK